MYHAGATAAFAPLAAIALLLASLATMLLAGAAIAGAGGSLLVALAVGELGLVAIPAAAALRSGRGAGALGLARPRPVHLAAAVLIGGSAWYLNLALVHWLRVPEGRLDVLERLVERPPLVVSLVAIAAIPALCEELMFRGVVTRSLATRFKPAAAVVLSAALFSAYHMSLPQAVPTFTLGLMLGALALRGGSVIPGMVCHFLNNTAALVVWRRELPALTGWLEAHPLLALIGAAAATSGGVALIAGAPAAAPPRARGEP